MRGFLLGAAALWVAGVALIALSVVRGGATVFLVVIIPVVSGSSVLFLLGVGLLIAGFVALLFAFSGEWEETPTPFPPSGPGSSGGAGGFVLIGPVPIVFGSWRGVSRRTRWALALTGAAILIVAWLVAAWLLR